MSDQYEYNDTSNTYGEDDIAGGGEQIATAIYLNQQVQQQAATILTKQNAIVLQPSSPPLNPKINDMWIDNNIYPSTLYTWDGTAWNKSGMISPDEMGVYTTAQVDDAVTNVQTATDVVSSRVDVNEGKLADGSGLFAKIKQTNEYNTDVAGQVSTGINGLIAGLQTDADIAQQLPKLARQSDLTATAAQLQAMFQAGGGVNLLKNSAGWGVDNTLALLNWQVTSGAATQYLGSDCVEAGAGISMTTGVIKQAITAVAGQAYTFTIKVKKGTAGTAYVKVSDGTTFQQIDFITSQAYDYKTVQVAGFVPATNQLIIELGATGASAIFTVMMLNKGTLGLQWSFADGESYNGKVSFDINGVKVQSSVYDGYTVMSPVEFAGYFRNNQGVLQKIFTLNGQFTEVAKLRLTDPNAVIQMGSLQMSYINVAGNRGWAITSSS
jgi:hypothetical protein